MREVWSLLVIIRTMNNQHAAAMQVLNFASPAWADTAYNNIRSDAAYGTSVIKLY